MPFFVNIIKVPLFFLCLTVINMTAVNNNTKIKEPTITPIRISLFFVGISSLPVKLILKMLYVLPYYYMSVRK